MALSTALKNRLDAALRSVGEAEELASAVDASTTAIGSATAADLTKLHSVTATAAEINQLSGYIPPVASRVAAPVTNITNTMAAITGLSANLVAGHKYIGELVVKCNNSTAAEGIAFDFNAGGATMTSFWAVASQRQGGTNVAGTVIATALNGAMTFTTITGETEITIDFSFVCNAAGTFIPEFAEGTAHSSGTATVEIGSFLWLQDCP